MAFRHGVATRASLIVRRVNPSIGCVFRDDDRKREPLNEALGQRKGGGLMEGRLFGSTAFSHDGVGANPQWRRCKPFSFGASTGLSLYRHMSTAYEESSDKVDYISDVAEIITDKTVEAVASQAPVVNEVAIAAADSFAPVAALQYLIDGVHQVTGFNWWASIALTTILIRTATIPFLINQIKATSKLNLMKPRLEELQQEIKNKAMDPAAVADGKKRMNQLFKEYGVTPFTPLKGLLIQGPVFICFFLAINNMVEKVPSFKNGGALWFTDLTTPDSLYIFPVLTALTFLITVECNIQEGMEGSSAAGTMKKFSRVLAFLTVPFTMSFPKALFCYWLTSNFFTLGYGLVMKQPGVKKALGLPEITVRPPSADAPKPTSFSFSEAMKQYQAALQQRQPPPPPSSADAPPKVGERKISSASVLNQRLKSLEKQVKGRKKNKKL
uniref:Membrane insertase YidC/Oxa/ALB C-terminal domain-containing protein n=1 Tax=Kalanchoe fedtschenkoi TaxID=63787 RepID=A0A7N0U1V4_KALFE